MRILVRIAFLSLFACESRSQKVNESTSTTEAFNFEVIKTEEEWKEQLGEEAYLVLRKKATEYAFTGEYNNFKEKGSFLCAGCGAELFTSDTKYDSGCGWPSFYAPVDKDRILEVEDNSHGMKRIEIMCAKCGGHLGHIFPDGPKPTGMRYCVNSLSLDFSNTQKLKTE